MARHVARTLLASRNNTPKDTTLVTMFNLRMGFTSITKTLSSWLCTKCLKAFFFARSKLLSSPSSSELLKSNPKIRVSIMLASIKNLNFCYAMMRAFILPSGWTKDRILTTSADSFFMKNFCLSSTDKHVYSFHFIPFHWMLLHQETAKIVTSPWVAEVYAICRPFSLLFNIFIFAAKLTTEQAQHAWHLTCGWITCWNFKAISQNPLQLECLGFTSWFWHGV